MVSNLTNHNNAILIAHLKHQNIKRTTTEAGGYQCFCLRHKIEGLN